VRTTDETHAAIVREVVILKKSPIFWQKEPYISTHKACIYLCTTLFAWQDEYRHCSWGRHSQKRPIFPQKSHIFPPKSPIYLQKGRVFSSKCPIFRESSCTRLTKRMPPLFARSKFSKEPYIFPKEPYISAKKPCISAKGPYISTKKLYISAKLGAHDWRNACRHCSWGRRSQKSPTFPQKSRIFPHQTPVHISAKLCAHHWRDACRHCSWRTYSQKRSILPRKQQQIPAKGPCISTKKPYISQKLCVHDRCDACRHCSRDQRSQKSHIFP